MEVFEVGGCVRDSILGIKPKDRDYVVVGSSVEEMLSLGYKQVGNYFPVFLHPENGEEYALARTEVRTGSGHTSFKCDSSSAVTLEQDLWRRDLTINAMARCSDGRIIDPFRGISDLGNGILRHVSNAFGEDPLRVLRLARFAARFPGFTVAEDTMDLMEQIYMRGELQDITPERVWMELEKVLQDGNNPWRFFQVLHECGADQHLFPELARLFGVPQPLASHPEGDVENHMDLCLAWAAKMGYSPIQKFAILCHDLGKGMTPKEILPRHINHEKNGVPVLNELCRRIKVPTEYKRLASLVVEKHLKYHKILEMKPGKITTLLDDLGAKHESSKLSGFVAAGLADSHGRAGCDPEAGIQNADYLVACAEAYCEVQVRTEDKEGKPLVGKIVGELLHMDRSEAIRSVVRPLPCTGPS